MGSDYSNLRLVACFGGKAFFSAKAPKSAKVNRWYYTTDYNEEPISLHDVRFVPGDIEDIIGRYDNLPHDNRAILEQKDRKFSSIRGAIKYVNAVCAFQTLYDSVPAEVVERKSGMADYEVTPEEVFEEFKDRQNDLRQNHLTVLKTIPAFSKYRRWLNISLTDAHIIRKKEWKD